MSERMVVIRTFDNEFDAGYARADLEASGIPSRLLTDGTGGVHPHLQFARGVRLAVPESRAEEALEVLSTEGEAQDEDTP
jgi:hypothetical protein